ncbi:unnamed protein product [Urochloa decumbens]|uniref:F-box domain-containing protein n=1 Tax=Urochloa decumbens TaxID=240449 RepID=A0ABC9FWR5_9POAL
MALAALTDDILSDIFLRLPEPADLVRTSAACVPFRRLVTGRAFLRRFRALNPAPLLGFLDHNGFHPAIPPHASAPAARAVSLAADFSFSFLPSNSSSTGRGWVVRDVRDGRVLLDRAPEDGGGEEPSVFFTEIAVCDPLHRRCVLLPPIPDDLAAAVDQPLRVEFDSWCEPFLNPGGCGDPEDEASFGVIWMARCKAKLVAFAFSSSTGEWRAVASLAWRDLMSTAGLPSRRPALYLRQYARGCFYWVMDLRQKLLVLDTGRMEFSIADLPPACHRRQIAIVEAGEGRVGMFALRDQVADGEVSLYYTVRQDIANGSGHWQMEKTIPLDPAFQHYIKGATERYILLLRCSEHLSSAGMHVSSSAEMEDLECFSMDVRTLQLERVCQLKHRILRAYIYNNFPPSLSPQSI